MLNNFPLNFLVGGLEFLTLWKDVSLVLTDSDRLQEETTALGIPCFMIRENTERPVTIEERTNRLIGTTGKAVLKAYNDFKGNNKKGESTKILGWKISRENRIKT